MNMTPEQQRADGAKPILDILRSRKGFSHWWDDIREDDQVEIIHAIADAITKVATEKDQLLGHANAIIEVQAETITEKQAEIDRLKAQSEWAHTCVNHNDAERASLNSGKRCPVCLKAELERVTKERDQWKANHDNQVAIKAALLDRPDLKDRAKRIQELIAERDTARRQLREALSFIEKQSKHGRGLCSHADQAETFLAAMLERQKGEQ